MNTFLKNTTSIKKCALKSDEMREMFALKARVYVNNVELCCFGMYAYGIKMCISGITCTLTDGRCFTMAVYSKCLLTR